MRKIEFEVPQQVFGDFAEKLTETGLENRVNGRTEDGDIEIEVFYEKDDAGLVDELEEYLEELKDGMESEEENDEDQ